MGASSFLLGAAREQKEPPKRLVLEFYVERLENSLVGFSRSE